MKILRITRLGYENGGVENGILLLNPILNNMGHTVKILTSNFRTELVHFSDFEFEALEHKSIIMRLLYRSFFPQPYFVLKKILHEYQPDIVQIHTISQISPSILFLLKNYPTVLTVHQGEDFTRELLLTSFPSSHFKDDNCCYGSLTFEGKLHYMYHRYISSFMYRLGFKNVDAFVVFSRYMQLELEKEGIKSDLIQNATRLFDFVPLNTNSKIISYAGRLEKIKGVEYLIKSFSKIIKSCPEAQLIIAGDGACKTELESLTKELCLENHVNFIGQQDRHQLYDLYKKSSVVVIPSLWGEAFGKVGIEAMSVGRPVIASNVGGIPEWLINGETGYLVQPASPEDIADKVIRLLKNPKLLQSMSLKAREQSKNFNIETHAKTIVQLYKKIIKKYNKRVT